MPKTNKPPKFRIHKTSGRALVVLNGVTLYLGYGDNAGTRAAYHRAVSQWEASNRQVVPRPEGAAGGLQAATEGITVILRQAEKLPTLDERLVLFAIGIVMFGIPLQLAFVLISFIQKRLSRVIVQAPPTEAT